MKKDFWDMTWNPVWGCLNNCPYCYARQIAKRYAEQIARKEMNYKYGKGWRYNKNQNLMEHEYLCLVDKLNNFKPTWLESNYVRKFPKKPSIIFVNSMSDPAYWEQEWYEKIVTRITENMQHTFVILTKSPEIYRKYTFPHNTILGVTCTTQLKINELECHLSNWWEPINKLLISIEPIQGKIYISPFLRLSAIDWIHVGQESGNRIYRIRATRGMIQPFFWLKDIPVFMKNNLAGIVPGMELRKEFPEL